MSLLFVFVLLLAFLLLPIVVYSDGVSRTYCSLYVSLSLSASLLLSSVHHVRFLFFFHLSLVSSSSGMDGASNLHRRFGDTSIRLGESAIYCLGAAIQKTKPNENTGSVVRAREKGPKATVGNALSSPHSTAHPTGPGLLTGPSILRPPRQLFAG